MARYIPQHVFDVLVIGRLLASLAGDDAIFDDLMNRYRDAYPDEDIGVLVADVNAAAVEGRKVVAELRAASDRDELATLQDLLQVLTEDATRNKPLWRRTVENYFFNVQPAPIPDRVRKAREHIVAARQALLARDRQLPVG
jgi:hypothetical protein